MGRPFTGRTTASRGPSRLPSATSRTRLSLRRASRFGRNRATPGCRCRPTHRPSARRSKDNGRRTASAAVPPKSDGVRFGSKADIRAATSHVRFTPESGHVRCSGRCPLRAMCGRLQVGKNFLDVAAHWSVRPCVRHVRAVLMTAGHNALRESEARIRLMLWPLVVCPDRCPPINRSTHNLVDTTGQPPTQTRRVAGSPALWGLPMQYHDKRRHPWAALGVRSNVPDMQLPVLDDAQQSDVINVLRPLDPLARDAFLNSLARLLQGRSQVGSGELHRLLVDLQREHFRYPRDTSRPTHSNSLAHRNDPTTLKTLGLTHGPETDSYRPRAPQIKNK
jgi:hypothetical protein